MVECTAAACVLVTGDPEGRGDPAADAAARRALAVVYAPEFSCLWFGVMAAAVDEV